MRLTRPLPTKEINLNIFYLHKSPVLAAQQMCDKHVVKMILESAQLLCTTHHVCPTDAELPAKFYKKTHINHPSAIWVRTSVANYDWMCLHAIALCKEYTHRYGKIHASQAIIEWCSDSLPAIPDSYQTEMPQCMPDEYKTDNSIQSYRDYYWHDKRKNIAMKWTKREKPRWWRRAESYENITHCQGVDK
tara:strand:- start:2120 stop:2689 length:570 start_codon:yes stop_codon:yes gene_type:complete